MSTAVIIWGVQRKYANDLLERAVRGKLASFPLDLSSKQALHCGTDLSITQVLWEIRPFSFDLPAYEMALHTRCFTLRVKKLY